MSLTKISVVEINRFNADRELIKVIREANRLGLEGKKVTTICKEENLSDNIEFKLVYVDNDPGQTADTVGNALRGMIT